MRELDISGMIAIGNGEPCPFCATEGDRPVKDIFINDKDNDIMEHMMDEHPSELNKALFTDPPPKPWLEQPFQLLLAKVYAKLTFYREDKQINQETIEDVIQAIYSDMKEFFANESK